MRRPCPNSQGNCKSTALLPLDHVWGPRIPRIQFSKVHEAAVSPISYSYALSRWGVDMDFYHLRDLQSSFSFHNWVNLTSLFLLRPLSLARIFASFHPLWYTRHVSSVREVFTEVPVWCVHWAASAWHHKSSWCERTQSAWLPSGWKWWAIQTTKHNVMCR